MDNFRRGISGSSIEFLGPIVRKSAEPGQRRRLMDQAKHLRQLHKIIGKNCARPIEIKKDSYTMEYFPGINLDVYCTMSTQQTAFFRLKEITHLLWKKLYSKHKQSFDTLKYLKYLKKRTQEYGALGEDVSKLNLALLKLESLFDGHTVLENLNAGLIHGDLTFENIMVTADSFFLIDSNPNPHNGVAPWTLDVGKIRQSIFSLYEITKYTGHRSRAGLKTTYNYLADRFARLFPRWNERINLQSEFFEASHYIRLLDYKYRLDSSLSRAYYQRALRLLKKITKSVKLLKK